MQYAGNTALASSLASVTGLPKVRYLFTTSWTYAALTANYLIHYSSSYEDPTIAPEVKVSSYMSQDLQLNIDCGHLAQASSWWSGVTFTLGVNDLTQARPPIFFAGPSGGGLLADGYDTSIVDPVGRFFYASVKISFPRHHSE